MLVLDLYEKIHKADTEEIIKYISLQEVICRGIIERSEDPKFYNSLNDEEKKNLRILGFDALMFLIVSEYCLRNYNSNILVMIGVLKYKINNFESTGIIDFNTSTEIRYMTNKFYGTKMDNDFKEKFLDFCEKYHISGFSVLGFFGNIEDEGIENYFKL